MTEPEIKEVWVVIHYKEVYTACGGYEGLDMTDATVYDDEELARSQMHEHDEIVKGVYIDTAGD